MDIKKSTRYGLVAGASVALSIAAVITVWEWLENPGGIFHGPEGTNWRFVAETAVSWLLPVFALTSVVAIACHFLFTYLRFRPRSRDGDGG